MYNVEVCYVAGKNPDAHLPVEGMHKGKLRRSCQNCGRWLDFIEGETRWYGIKEKTCGI